MIGRGLLLMLAGAFGAAALFYLTPLKHVNVIDPLPRDIDPSDFLAEFRKNPDQYLFLDVRSKAAYDIVHAEGSVSQPIASLYDLRSDLPYSGKTIVLICSTGRLAGVAYGFLEHWGHRNLLRIEGGIQRWIVEGLPVSGSDVSFIPASD